MGIRVLGPVSFEDGGTSVDIDSPKERAALVTLALNPGRSINSSRLIEGLWGSSPPDTADKTLQWHVSRLRKAIGPDTLLTTPTGYLLDVPPSAVDAIEFETLLKQGSAALSDGRPMEASARLEAAMQLWRGEPFGDLADSEYRSGQERRFGELFLLLQELRFEASLAMGRHDHVVPDLEAFVAEHPYREQPWMLLMLALYRSERQAAALRAFQRLRLRLLEDLGIEPSDAAVALEERILRRDPQLDLVPPPPQHNLPMRTTSFVGRDQELADVTSAVADHRLVSIVGAGGIGKSRLAAESGAMMLEGFPDGVWWIDLASLTPADDLVARTALSIGAPLAGSPDPGTALTLHLRNRTTLIVLDNCEHLRAEAASLASMLLGAGPSIRVLTTTRVAIALPEEHRIVVPPLPSQPVDDGVSPAAALFIDRSHSAAGQPVEQAEVAHIEDLVRRIDGMPLSIELAAARSKVLSASELALHLSASFEVPVDSSGADHGRHHSVGRVLDWSYDLLDVADRLSFDRLGVFRGTFDLAAAAAVLGHDDPSDAVEVLGRLLDASMLIRTSEDGVRRFRLLEPLRLYALSHLSEADLLDASKRHCDHYRGICTGEDFLRRPDALGWRTVLSREDHNIIGAIEWSRTHESGNETLEFADAIGQSLYRRGEYVRCVEIVDTLLTGAPDAPAPLEALVRSALVWPLFLLGDAQRAFAENQISLEKATEAGDRVLIGWAWWNEAHMLMLGLSDFEHAQPLYERTIDLVREDPHEVGFLAGLAFAGHSQARALMGVSGPSDREDLAFAEQRLLDLNDLSGVAHVWMARWIVDLADDRYDDCLHSAQENVRYAREAQDPVYEQIGLSGVATSLHLLGRTREAYDVEFEAVRICQATNNIMQLGVSLMGLGVIAMSVGAWEAGAKLWGAGRTVGAPWPVFDIKHAVELEQCRAALGDRFDELVQAGQHLSPDEAVGLAALLPVE